MFIRSEARGYGCLLFNGRGPAPDDGKSSFYDVLSAIYAVPGASAYLFEAVTGLARREFPNVPRPDASPSELTVSQFGLTQLWRQGNVVRLGAPGTSRRLVYWASALEDRGRRREFVVGVARDIPELIKWRPTAAHPWTERRPWPGENCVEVFVATRNMTGILGAIGQALAGRTHSIPNNKFNRKNEADYKTVKPLFDGFVRHLRSTLMLADDYSAIPLIQEMADHAQGGGDPFKEPAQRAIMKRL